MSIVHIRFPVALTGELKRAPHLESLLAQATTTPSTEEWRREAFRVIAGPDVPVPAVASAAMAGAIRVTNTGAAKPAVAGEANWVCVATPLHCVAGMSNITLAADGLLNLDISEADRLASDFNRVFSGSGRSLAAGTAARLMCVFDRPIEASTSDPDRVVGNDLFDFQPTGPDASRLRAAMSEFEMWLYENEVNRARVAQGLPPVTGLWLWGGGPILPIPPPVRGWTAGRDPLFAAFGDLPAFPEADGTQAVRPGVVVCSEGPGSRSWSDVESRWIAPAAAALRTGALESVVLSVGAQRFDVTRGGRWRFWRRPRPWWESMRMEGSE